MYYQQKHGITISIKLRNEDGAKIIYIIKEKGASQDIEKTELSHTFVRVQAGKEYEITIETKNEYGEDTKTVSIILRTITINDPESLGVIEGETQQISYTISPEVENANDIIWTSSNEKIVKVDNKGNITEKFRKFPGKKVLTQ